MVSLFFPERVPLICTYRVLWERYNINHAKTVLANTKAGPLGFQNFTVVNCVESSAKVSVPWDGLYTDRSEGWGWTLFIWSRNWLTDAFSVSLEIDGKLQVGKTRSTCSSVRRRLVRALFHPSGKYTIWRGSFIVDMGRRESRHFCQSHVGIWPLLCCLFGYCLRRFLITSSDKGWKEKNISLVFMELW